MNSSFPAACAANRGPESPAGELVTPGAGKSASHSVSPSALGEAGGPSDDGRSASGEASGPASGSAASGASSGAIDCWAVAGGLGGVTGVAEVVALGSVAGPVL